MNVVVVGVFDSAMQAFGRPFFVPSAAVAIRSFVDEVNRKAQDNLMSVHPEDFELFEIAEFVEETGVFNLVPKRSLMRGKDAVSA